MAELIFKSRTVQLYRCTAHGQLYNGFRLPVNSLYGRDKKGCFVVTSTRNQYSTYWVQKQAQNGAQYTDKLRALVTPFTLKVRRYKSNPFLPTLHEWHDAETEPEASSLWNAVTYWFDTLPNQYDPRLQQKPFREERKENTPRAKSREIYREAKHAATGLRQPPPPETNIYYRGGRHVSLDAWNGNI